MHLGARRRIPPRERPLRTRRKLFITADARHAEEVVAPYRATYITVDPSVFEGFPDPR